MKTSKHPKLTNGQPAISCFHLSLDLLLERDSRAAQLVALEVGKLERGLGNSDLQEAYATITRGIMWHPDFAAGLKLLVCDTPLFRVVADLPSQLEEANGGRRLDFWDYCYVADELRALLLEYALPKGDRIHLHRALAWVEEMGGGLRDYTLEA